MPPRLRLPPDPALAVAALLALRSRGEIRQAGDWLDGEGTGLRATLLEAARARGVTLPDDVDELPGKKLLRLCMGRGEEAQIVSTPTSLDESFTCAHCGADVPPGGRRPRDHCPRCLHSLHVDIVPGDRAAGCGGLLVPVALEVAGGRRDVRYRCARCGEERRNRVLDDVHPPDDPDVVLALARATADALAGRGPVAWRGRPG